ncbi:immunoglobulin-like domain-containing protein [Clostridium sp. C105KSO13]|uniref:immunoglobulin-like domain-containing protein n=1 Tax=Clostridium sp. C105KSO13 TaxID=1776045 RepID=UPI000740899A|nr:immunoglobulin-like domain-containing protein [Clostridium sp. C105KSO13]CUX45963.1 hypothetical protein BN3456_02556 [Clostridium sp. C105KSO13]
MKQRLLTVMLLMGCAILCVIGFFLYVGQDKQPPKISVKKMNITYHEGGDYDSLLKGVKAKDNRDGDLSSKVFVDRIIPTEDGKAVISYGVIDKRKNVGTATRIVKYMADAHKETNEDADPAEDNASDDIEAVDAEAKESEQVAEKAEQDAALEKEEQANAAPDLALSTGQAVIEAGTEFDPLSVVAGVSDATDAPDVLLQQITVEGDYDIYTPGDYQLNYYVTDSDGNTSEARPLTLTVQ